MGIQTNSSSAAPVQDMDLNDEANWNELYTSLRTLARYLVYAYRISLWRGQEEELIEDIVQETSRRLLERVRKAERGEAGTVYSLKYMMTTIAQNYCRDLRRHDRRVFHFPEQEEEVEALVAEQEQTEPLEEVIERMYQEWVLTTVAHKIAHFPEKQREAILTDLANHMSFDGHPTPLQKAFLEEGIQLEHYRKPLPADLQERGRYLSLRSLAYKRVARLHIQDMIE